MWTLLTGLRRAVHTQQETAYMSREEIDSHRMEGWVGLYCGSLGIIVTRLQSGSEPHTIGTNLHNNTKYLYTMIYRT